MHNILFIDDEPGIVSGLAETVNRENLELQAYTASTVKEGIKIAKQTKLDILCSDIEMPVQNGFQFAEEVLKYWKDCKIVFLTGYNEFDYIYKSVNEFGGQYVLKSDEEKLVDIIRKNLLQIETEQRNKLISKKIQKLMEDYENSRKEKLWAEYLRNPEDTETVKALAQICEEEGFNLRLPVKCGVGRLLKPADGRSITERELTQYFLKVKEEYRYFYHVYIVFLLHGQGIEWIKVIPYLVVLGMAVAGVNVMLVLLLGILSTGIIGIYTGTAFFDWFGAMGTGITGMGELIIITLLAGGMLETIRHNGGIDFIISRLTRHVSGKRGAEFSIAALVSIANLCTANNTIAIITTGPIAKDIALRFHLDRRKTASILDTFSCLVQGIIPYGAQMLIASGLACISPISIIGNLYYPFCMGACATLAILLRYPRKYSGK